MALTLVSGVHATRPSCSTQRFRTLPQHVQCRQRLATAAAAAVALPALDGIFFLTTRADASCSLSCLAQGLGQVVHPGVQVVHVPSCRCLYAVYQYPVPGMLVGTGRACLNQSSELHLYFCYTYNVHHAKSGRLWIMAAMLAIQRRRDTDGTPHQRGRAVVAEAPA